VSIDNPTAHGARFRKLGGGKGETAHPVGKKRSKANTWLIATAASPAWVIDQPLAGVLTPVLT